MMEPNMHEPIQMDIQELQPDEITLDKLIGTWKIFQLKRGHRFSVDDQMTAVLAAELAPKNTTKMMRLLLEFM